MKTTTILLLIVYFAKISYGQTKGEVEWIKDNASEIINDNDDFQGFEFLDPLLVNRRIVMLGENTHGSNEYFYLKNRMIRYLHEQLGFNVLAWESNILDCYAVENSKENLAPKEMAMSSLHFVYRTDQVIPIIDYVKSSDIIFAGFDSQPTVYTDATANYLRSLECLGDPLRTELAYVDSLAQTYSKYAHKNKNRKKHALLYEESINKIADCDCPEQLKELLTLGIEDRIHNMNNWSIGRDERMAKNLMWLLTKAYPEEKFIIYAHNSHNDPNNQKNQYANYKTMAEFLPDSIIQQSYNIAFFGYRGNARNNVGESFYEFESHPEKSLENYLNTTGYEITFLNLESVTRTNNNSFLFEQINTMYWGNIENPKILSEHYDGVILVNSISPSIKLSR